MNLRKWRALLQLASDINLDTGLADLGSTQEVLAAAGAFASRLRKEKCNEEQPCIARKLVCQQLRTKLSLEALTLTPDMMCQVHRGIDTLMRGLVHDADRLGKAHGSFATGLLLYASISHQISL